jgi:hypothetical protein
VVGVNPNRSTVPAILYRPRPKPYCHTSLAGCMGRWLGRSFECGLSHTLMRVGPDCLSRTVFLQGNRPTTVSVVLFSI